MRSRLTELLGIEVPIIQAPMAGSNGPALAVAVAEAGGLGSLPAAMLTPDALRRELDAVVAGTTRPVNVNFFCHQQPLADPSAESRWRARLAAYYDELGLELPEGGSGPSRAPFDDALCEVVEERRPAVVSFHFGLPPPPLLARVRATGARVLSTATSVAEARWLEAAGCDAVIAQGVEAGGHRGVFLTADVTTQVATMALVPQVVDAVRVPVVAAGGIADGRGIVAALALGAAGVQLGTAFLRCPAPTPSDVHRRALTAAGDDTTALTNVFTGRPARGIMNRLMTGLGPLADDAPPFPLAASPLAPLRSRAEANGSGDFSPLWAGQAAPLARAMPAGELTRLLVAEADRLLEALARRGGAGEAPPGSDQASAPESARRATSADE